ncbi:MAG: GNAT family N-acetyltransferase [Alphaproteobacteria bacterium]|nr:GNAT family N-acetyltransferase [Alphaproteobacteria bacterium]
MSGRRALSSEEAGVFLRGLREGALAGVVEGRPVVRAMHAWWHDDALWFHGGPRVAVSQLAGGPVAFEGHALIARIPSWMRHPERACPATTWYRSVLVEGTLEAVADPMARAAALQAMMEVQQPEGRHLPLDADHPLYAASVRGLGFWRVPSPRVTGVEKLGQDQTADHLRGILRGLWARGGEGDLGAIEAATAAHPHHPRFAELRDGWVPRCHPSPRDLAAAVALVADEYWNRDFPREGLLTAHAACDWVGVEIGGELVATTRILSDRGKRAWIYDVGVAPAWRGRGVGSAVLGLALDHPAVRDLPQVWLTTRDADPFYERFGFRTVRVDEGPPYRRAHMVRTQADAAMASVRSQSSSASASS